MKSNHPFSEKAWTAVKSYVQADPMFLTVGPGRSVFSDGNVDTESIIHCLKRCDEWDGEEIPEAHRAHSKVVRLALEALLAIPEDERRTARESACTYPECNCPARHSQEEELRRICPSGIPADFTTSPPRQNKVAVLGPSRWMGPCGLPCYTHVPKETSE